MNQACPGDTTCRDLQRKEQDIERPRRGQAAYIGYLNAQTLHLAVQQILIGARVAGKTVLFPFYPLLLLLTAPLERLRQAGSSSSSG